VRSGQLPRLTFVGAPDRLGQIESALEMACREEVRSLRLAPLWLRTHSKTVIENETSERRSDAVACARDLRPI
jgi:hypothetical protein